MLRIATPAAATLAAAFLCGSLWRAGYPAPGTLLACAGIYLLVVTLTRMQIEQSRRMLDDALAAVGDRIRVFGPMRLRRPQRGRISVDYLVVGPEQRAWPLLTDGISQWRTPRRAKSLLGRRAALADAAAAAIRAALREGRLPRGFGLAPDASVQPLVVPLRRRVAPERMGAAVVANMEELAAVLLGSRPVGPAQAEEQPTAR